MSIFKAGSIRGKYGEEWDREVAYRIGYYIPDILKGKNIVVGRDGRNSSPEIFKAVTEGLMLAGCSVTDIGMIDTPGLMFSNIKYGFDGAVMITASHNPPDYNGLKISGKSGLVISKRNGLKKLEELVQKPVGPELHAGTIQFFDIKESYLSVFNTYIEDVQGELKCIVDCSNGMASILINKTPR